MRKVLLMVFIFMAILAQSQNRQKTIILYADSFILDTEIIAQKTINVSFQNTIDF